MMSGGRSDWECSPYHVPAAQSDDIDWGLLKKALFQGIGKKRWDHGEARVDIV